MQEVQLNDTEKQLIQITKQLIAESGENRSQEVSLTASLQRHIGMDSLMRAELFQRVEKSFAVTLPDRLLAEADSLADIENYIRQKAPASDQVQTQMTTEVQSSEGLINPAHAQSFVEVLTLYAHHSPDRAHVYFLNEDGKQEILTYGNLFAKAASIARSLQKRGMQPGDTIAIMQPTQLGFFYTYFGILLAGCIPVPIYPPFRPHMLEAYAKTESRILQNAEVRMLVTFQQAETLSRLMRAFVPSLREVITVDELLASNEQPLVHTAAAHDPALIQYTSGSTSTPKGVLLSHHNLLSNIRTYADKIKMSPNDIAVSWLPLYHDFGLIGTWLGCIYTATPLVLMTPFSFLNRPERWLWAIHHYRGTLAGGPNFAYELCVKKIDPSLIEGLDLSSWRVAANGAEAIYPKTLENFVKKFAPYGFKREAILPAYGLAESTVCLSIPPVGQAPVIDYVDRHQFESEKKAIPVKQQDNNSLGFVSCGQPLSGHEVRIVDEQNHDLAERNIGSIQFRGPSTMQGYYNNPQATAAITHNGWVDTGDMGYIGGGNLFITGRKKDLIIKAGRNLYPAEIEELVGNVRGIRQGCVVAFGTGDPQRGTDKLVVVAETREADKSKHRELTATINDIIATRLDIVPDQIVLVAPHVVPKTSSGKLQRSACKAAYQEGRLTRQLPAWMQVSKIGWRWFTSKAWRMAMNVCKAFYTAYIVSLITLTILPVWVSLHFVSTSVARKIIRAWATVVRRASFSPLTVMGAENLTAKTPMIYTANHTSYIDPVILMEFLSTDVRFVGKKELITAPFVKTFIEKLGYLSVDRIDLTKGVEDTRQIEKALREGHSIMMFPEGTFSYAAGLRPFKSGAFKIASETNTAICPIAIQGTRKILRGEEKLLRPAKITVTVGKPVLPTGTEWADIIELKNKVRACIAEHCGEASLDFITPTLPATRKE